MQRVERVLFRLCHVTLDLSNISNYIKAKAGGWKCSGNQLLLLTMAVIRFAASSSYVRRNCNMCNQLSLLLSKYFRNLYSVHYKNGSYELNVPRNCRLLFILAQRQFVSAG